ncbi:hypothetical protein LINPERHAP2_LOCUS22472, partial [Linum perenne]
LNTLINLILHRRANIRLLKSVRTRRLIRNRRAKPRPHVRHLKRRVFSLSHAPLPLQLAQRLVRLPQLVDRVGDLFSAVFQHRRAVLAQRSALLEAGDERVCVTRRLEADGDGGGDEVYVVGFDFGGVGGEGGVAELRVCGGGAGGFEVGFVFGGGCSGGGGGGGLEEEGDEEEES